MLPTDLQAKIVAKFIDKNNLKLIPHGIINTPTERGTNIDLCMVGVEEIRSNYAQSDSPFMNMHFLILTTLSFIQCVTSSEFLYRKILSMDKVCFIERLSEESWAEFYNDAIPHDKLYVFSLILTGILDELAPLTHSNFVQNSDPWI